MSSYNKIIIGFVAHWFGFLFYGMAFPQMITAICGGIGWFYILKGFIAIHPKGFNLNFKPGYTRFIQFYLLLCLITIIRGYLIDYPYQWISTMGMINYHFLNPYYILCYSMPFVVLIPHQNYNFRLIVKLSCYSAFIVAICLVIFYNDIIQTSLLKSKGFDAVGDSKYYAFIYTQFGFVCILWKYIDKKTWIINLLGGVVSLTILILMARRGSSLMLAILICYSLYSVIHNTHIGYKFTLLLLFIGGGILLFRAGNQSGAFNYILERGMEDSRSAVDEALLAQTSDLEIVFGKGLNGRYYLPLRSLEEDPWNGWRYGSETGFYNILLRGGYLLGISYILLLLYPAYLGLLRSKNLLTRSGGFYILLSLGELYPFGWLSFDVKFLIIWMLIALCYSKKVRNMTDQEIKMNYF